MYMCIDLYMYLGDMWLWNKMIKWGGRMIFVVFFNIYIYYIFYEN